MRRNTAPIWHCSEWQFNVNGERVRRFLTHWSLNPVFWARHRNKNRHRQIGYINNVAEPIDLVKSKPKLVDHCDCYVRSNVYVSQETKIPLFAIGPNQGHAMPPTALRSIYSGKDEHFFWWYTKDGGMMRIDQVLCTAQLIRVIRDRVLKL